MLIKARVNRSPSAPGASRDQEVPNRESDQRNRDNHRDKYCRDPVRQLLDRRLASLGFLHQPDDLRQGSLSANAGSLEFYQAELIEGRAGHAVPGSLLDGHGFAGQHGFIHG